MKQKWNDRYSSEEYYFGKEPNDFLKESIENISPGKALFVGDGEGRNSVYAAKLGWSVDSIDISDIGKSKADKLAAENNVKINYILADAIERAGSTDRGAIRDAVAATKNFPSVTGAITFTEVGDVMKEYTRVQVQNGEFVVFLP